MKTVCCSNDCILSAERGVKFITLKLSLRLALSVLQKGLPYSCQMQPVHVEKKYKFWDMICLGKQFSPRSECSFCSK